MTKHVVATSEAFRTRVRLPPSPLWRNKLKAMQITSIEVLHSLYDFIVATYGKIKSSFNYNNQNQYFQ